MSAFPVGTVAVATVRGVEGVRILRSDGYWRTALEVGGNVTHYDYNGGVTDVRPLVVLDPNVVSYAVGALEGSGDNGDRYCATQMRDALLKSRIPEPDWGVIVVAATQGKERRQFVHAYRFRGGPGGVWTDTDGFHAAWTDLIDPEVVAS